METQKPPIDTVKKIHPISKRSRDLWKIRNTSNGQKAMKEFIGILQKDLHYKAKDVYLLFLRETIATPRLLERYLLSLGIEDK